MLRRQFLTGCLTATLGAFLTGCYGPGYGPPPQAPAYGYRRKHPSGVQLSFDPDLGVYAVVGYPYYFYDGLFYWERDGAWFVKRDWGDDWRPAGEHRIPHGLVEKFHGRPHGELHGFSPGKLRGRGHGFGLGDLF